MEVRTITDPGADFKPSSQSRRGSHPNKPYLRYSCRYIFNMLDAPGWRTHGGAPVSDAPAQPVRPSSPITTENQRLVSLRHFISGSLTTCCRAEFDASRRRRLQAGDGLSRRAAGHDGRNISASLSRHRVVAHHATRRPSLWRGLRGGDA